MSKRCTVSPQEVTVVTTINKFTFPCPPPLLLPGKAGKGRQGSRGQESDEAVITPSEGADKWSRIQKGFREPLKLAVNKVLELRKGLPRQR